jgi:hypothetical protein
MGLSNGHGDYSAIVCPGEKNTPMSCMWRKREVDTHTPTHWMPRDAFCTRARTLMEPGECMNGWIWGLHCARAAQKRSGATPLGFSLLDTVQTILHFSSY